MSTENKNQVVKSLAMATKQNKAFNAVAHVFALRERSRKQLTIHALQYKMRTEGFTFSQNEYEHIVKFLGSLNLGTVKTNKRGKVIGLFNIKHTLQSIGQAALGQLDDIELMDTKPVVQPQPVWQRNIYPSVLTVFVAGKPINVNLAPSLSKDEVKTVIEKFADTAMGVSTIVNGKTVNMSFGKDAGSEEIASIIKRVQGRVV